LSSAPEDLRRWASLQPKFRIHNQQWQAQQLAAQQRGIARFEQARQAELSEAAKTQRRAELGI